jgi:hypothetical protein
MTIGLVLAALVVNAIRSAMPVVHAAHAIRGAGGDQSLARRSPAG